MEESLLQKAQRLGIKPASTPVKTESLAMKAQRLGIQPGVQEPPQKSNFLKQLATGMGASIIKTVAGFGDLVRIKRTPFGERLLKSANELDKGTAGKKIGEFVGNVAQIVAPVSKVGTVLKAAPFLARVGAKAATTGAIVSAQEGKVGSGAVIGAGVEAAFPVAGKVLKPVVNRLVKSLASGLSGVSSKSIEAMGAKAGFSKGIANQVDTQGTSGIIKKNAETIINGVSNIRKEARVAYGNAVDALKAVDIDPKKFRSVIQPVLKEVGSVVKGGKRVLTNVEFESPAMLKRANTIINKLSTTKLDGLSLRKTLSFIENAKFKTTGSDPNRLAFNAFTRDLSDGVRKAINESTSKLDEINKAYSKDLQISEAIEDIFGEVQFKNQAEIAKVARRLETLFSKKGLDPETIDDFLTRVGVVPAEFRASEAVRQISDVSMVKNTEGLTIAEMIRGLTSAVVTPKAVRDITIQTGIAGERLTPILNSLTPTLRASFIKLLADVIKE